jgi:NADPH:quinone reductase-like Zn-dependent oxidoreductase
MESMKAVRVHSYGGPEVLRFEDAPRPSPGSGEVLMRVHAASVNPIDFKARTGYLKAYIPLHYLSFPVGVLRALSRQQNRAYQVQERR